MNNTHEITKKLIHTIYQMLSEDLEYDIFPEVFLHLQSILNADIYTFSEVIDYINIKSFDGVEIGFYRFLDKKPITIDPPPIFVHNKMVGLRPVLLLKDNCSSQKDLWVIIHEICHLFSIGRYSWDVEKGEYIHHYGLNRYSYDRNMQMVSCKMQSQLNEVFNDAATWHFIEIIKKHSVKSVNQYIDFHCRNIKERLDIKKLIGFYINGMIDDLLEKLDGSSYILE